MMDLLKCFSTLALIAGALLTLLPEGSIRKTAALAFGLMLTLCWVEGMLQLWQPEHSAPIPAAILQNTSLSLAQAEADALSRLAPEVTQKP